MSLPNTDNSQRRAPFIYDAWNCPEILTKLSQIAGIDLTVVFDWETANINTSVNEDPLAVLQPKVKPESPGEDTPAFAWHYDSYPFVCVTMLSDCTGMTGGETAVRTPSGEIHKIRGPAMVGKILIAGYFPVF